MVMCYHYHIIIIIIIIIMNIYIAPFRMPQRRFGQWSELENR